MNQIQKIDTDVLTDIHNFVNFSEGNKNIEYLASGKYGDVFTYQDEVAFKVFKDGAKYKDDSLILSDLQGIDGFPDLYAAEPGKYMVMEKINGQTIYGIEGKSNLLLDEYSDELHRIIGQAEDRGWIADDVHLNNIMLDEAGHLHLIDVGMFERITSENPEEVMNLGFFSLFRSSSHRHRRGRGHGYGRRRSSSDYYRRGHRRRHRHSYSSYSRSFSFFSS